MKSNLLLSVALGAALGVGLGARPVLERNSTAPRMIGSGQGAAPPCNTLVSANPDSRFPAFASAR